MANEIRPGDVGHEPGDGDRRRFAEQPDFTQQGSPAMPPLRAEPRAGGFYDRNLLRTNPPPLDLETETDSDDDLGLPPSYSATDYGRVEEYEEERRPRRSRWLPVGVAVLALAGFGGVVWYAYDWSSIGAGGGKVPIIQASADEEKIKPDNEAGMDVPNQESTVLNPQAAKPVEEVLMPSPEEPVVLIDRSKLDNTVVVLSPATTTTAPPAPPAPSAEGSMQPPGTDTIAAIIAAQTQTPAAAQPSAEEQATDGAAAAPPAPATEPPATVTPAAAPVAPSIPLPAPGTGAPAAIPAGAFLIQLASLTSADAAEQTWSRLQRQHAALLGDMAVNIQKAEIDGKGTYFRVQAGPLPNRATADDMCAQLKAAQQDCIVVKR